VATNGALKKDHIRIAEDRRRMGIQAKGPKHPTNEQGHETWRHTEYLPDPYVRQALKSRMRPVPWDKEPREGGP